MRHLNPAVRDHRRHPDDPSFETSLLPIAAQLVTQVETWLIGDEQHTRVTADAHLTGPEFEYEFTLYRCNKGDDGPGWEKEDEWKASPEDECEANVVMLSRPAPHGEEVASVATQLAEFVSKVDEAPSIAASAELTRSE